MKAPKPAPLNKKRVEDFIYLYLQISPQVCQNAFSTHYGHDGDYYFKQLQKKLSKQALLSSQHQDSAQSESALLAAS